LDLFWFFRKDSGTRVPRHVSRALLLMLGLLSVGACHASASTPGTRPVVTLASPFAPDSFRGTWYRLLYTEAFRRLGKDFHYLELPLRRATLMARHSTIDGEAGRVGSYVFAATDIERVPVRLWTARFVAISHDPAIKVTDWKDLKSMTGMVDYRRGVWITEHRLKRIRSGETINAVTSPTQGLKRLLAGRSRLYVDVEQQVNRTLAQPRFRNTPLYKAGVLASMPIYPYLVSRKRALVAPLTRVLRKMRSEGLFARYEAMARAQTGFP